MLPLLSRGSPVFRTARLPRTFGRCPEADFLFDDLGILPLLHRAISVLLWHQYRAHRRTGSASLSCRLDQTAPVQYTHFSILPFKAAANSQLQLWAASITPVAAMLRIFVIISSPSHQTSLMTMPYAQRIRIFKLWRRPNMLTHHSALHLSNVVLPAKLMNRNSARITCLLKIPAP